MPLRDHFGPPLDDHRPWEGFHGQWPAMIVQGLNAKLPPEYFAAPRVHLGSAFEIDVATFEGGWGESFAPTKEFAGDVAVAAWSPEQPALLLETELPVPPEYEVLVYDEQFEKRLVAAIELVSPANKDRPEHRRTFVQKCEALLHNGVCVVIVDLVTIRAFNLYRELAELIGATEPVTLQTQLYAVTCRSLRHGDRWRVEAWEHPMTIGQPLPTLPLWLADNLAIPLDLERSYEDTCRALRIP